MLYQSERYQSSATLQYRFAVPNGAYTVRLKFAEIYFSSAGKRIFNIALNGLTVESNFDAAAAAGGAYRAVDRSFAVSTSNGQIAIDLVPVISNPKISAIEITAGTSSSIGITLSPGSVTLMAGQQQQFTGTVTGSTNTSVRWSLNPSSAGSISTAGLYTAPSSIAADQTVTLTAAADADPTKTATAAITLKAATSSFSPIRVNTGGPAYTDPAGQLWSADTGFTGGSTYGTGTLVANTTTSPLYQSTRYEWNNPVRYRFSVPNGTYTVRLKFAEIYFSSTGLRVFNLNLNGQLVQANFDIVAAAGGSFRAVDRVFTVPATTGQIAIDLTPVVENPSINAIEITSGSTSTVGITLSPGSATLTGGQQQQFTASVTGSTNTAVRWSLSPAGAGTISATGLYTAPASIAADQAVTLTAAADADPSKTAAAIISLKAAAGSFTPVRVNAGGPSYTDSAGQLWTADTGFIGGSIYATGSPIANTATPLLYQSERYKSGATLQYRFTVPNGTYNVRLKFAEIYFSSSGKRIFNIALNGQVVLANFDIVPAAGGAYRAVDRSFTVSVSSGQIAIDLIPVVENPKISAIEITGL